MIDILRVIVSVGVIIGVAGIIAIWKKRGKYPGLLIIQFFLAVLALLWGTIWFLTGIELLPQGCWIWAILQRGSLSAVETVAGILGIGNILFGWIYSERNKLVLGKTQFDLIQNRYGNLYTASVITHFSATVLCLLFAKTGSREGTLFSFLALLWGCIPQAMICYQIAFNQKSSEDLAIHLWRENEITDYKKASIITEMIGYLGDVAVYRNQYYRELLFNKFAEWIRKFPEVEIKSRSQLSIKDMANDIRRISLQLRTMMEKVPQREQTHFFGDLFQTTGTYVEAEFAMSNEKLMQTELLCCGYIHYLYTTSGDIPAKPCDAQRVDSLANQISKLIYYTQNQGLVFIHISTYLQELLEGLEWYMFITQRVQLPRYSSKHNRKVSISDEIFIAFIDSVFDYDDKVKLIGNAEMAWKQV